MKPNSWWVHFLRLLPSGLVIEIIIRADKVATESGTVSSDVVKAEIVETVQMTDGIRGVINRLTVAP